MDDELNLITRKANLEEQKELKETTLKIYCAMISSGNEPDSSYDLEVAKRAAEKFLEMFGLE